MFVLGHLGIALLVGRLAAPLVSARERLPLGFLLLGALLPDLVDKPLGHLFLPWDNGRLWAHTLLFAGALTGLALLAASRPLGALAGGTLVHQLLDQAWLAPTTWFWPLAGPFPRGVSAGAPDWIAALLGDPYIWATEGLGLLALAAFLASPLVGLGPRWWTGETVDRSPVDGLGSDPDPEAEG